MVERAAGFDAPQKNGNDHRVLQVNGLRVFTIGTEIDEGTVRGRRLSIIGMRPVAQYRVKPRRPRDDARFKIARAIRELRLKLEDGSLTKEEREAADRDVKILLLDLKKNDLGA